MRSAPLAMSQSQNPSEGPLRISGRRRSFASRSASSSLYRVRSGSAFTVWVDGQPASLIAGTYLPSYTGNTNLGNNNLAKGMTGEIDYVVLLNGYEATDTKALRPPHIYNLIAPVRSNYFVPGTTAATGGLLKHPGMTGGMQELTGEINA